MKNKSVCIEYCIMILCNVTTIEEGQKHFLGEGKVKGMIIDNLFGMFCYFPKMGIFDFVANIMSNVSAIKDAREYMIENKIFMKILELLKKNEVNKHRRCHLIEAIRNIAFEYEKYEKIFIENTFVKDIAYILA